jgi:phosphoserine phosphatase
MTLPHWQLQTPVDAIVFDCDGTLSAIEGINELARNNGVYEIVEALTTEAMDKTGLNPALYQKRLELIHPTKQQVETLAETYYTQKVMHASDVIELLQCIGKYVYIISAGVNPAIRLLGHQLHVPHEYIYAVNLNFDAAGHYTDFDRSSLLIHNHGKRDLIMKLKQKHAHIIHIGDALNDYVTHDIVTRFIGYGGVYYRAHMEARCHFYIRTLSLAPLLALCLTQTEYQKLTPDQRVLYNKGLKAIKKDQVKV